MRLVDAVFARIKELMKEKRCAKMRRGFSPNGNRKVTNLAPQTARIRSESKKKRQRLKAAAGGLNACN